MAKKNPERLKQCRRHFFPLNLLAFLFSIRNNNGCLASEVATMCGYEECAKYLQAATQRQENEMGGAKGVYQAGPGLHAVTTPSPHDITVPQKVEPCVRLQGLNGGRLPPAGPAGDSAMETESHDTAPRSLAASVQCRTDVTLASSNVVVAGRKRAREDTDDSDSKRIRISGGC